MKHALSFRGEHHAIPAGMGVCTRCGAVVNLEQWLDATCPGQPPREVDYNDLSDALADLKAARGDDDGEE